MKKFLRNTLRKMDASGEIDISNVMRGIVILVIGAILIGALLPSAINGTARSTSGNNNYVGGVNISAGGDGVSKSGNWTTGMMTTWDAIPLLAVLAMLILVVMFGLRFVKG